MWGHIRHVRWVLARYLDDVLNSCLRIEDNRVIFLLLTSKGDPEWHYQVEELSPRLVIITHRESVVDVTGTLQG